MDHSEGLEGNAIVDTYPRQWLTEQFQHSNLSEAMYGHGSRTIKVFPSLTNCDKWFRHELMGIGNLHHRAH